MYFKDIETAIRVTRPTDRITKILSKRFAIVQSLYTNGSYSPESVAVLVENEVRFCGELRRQKDVVIHCLNTPKFSYYHKYIGNGSYRSVRCDNRRYLKRHRQLAHELTRHNLINL